MHRVEQIERPLGDLVFGQLLTGIQGDGNQRPKAKHLDRHPDAKNGSGGAGNGQKQHRHTRDQNRPLSGHIPGQAKEGHQGHAFPAVIRMEQFRRQGERNGNQHFPQHIRELFHRFQGAKTKKQGKHHILVPPVYAAEQGQIKHELRQQRTNGQPQGVFFRVSGVVSSLRQQETEDRKRQPANGTPLQRQPEHRCHMVDKHGHAGQNLQRFLGEPFLYHGITASFFFIIHPPDPKNNSFSPFPVTSFDCFLDKVGV